MHHGSERVEEVARPHDLRVHDDLVDEVVGLSHQLVGVQAGCVVDLWLSCGLRLCGRLTCDSLLACSTCSLALVWIELLVLVEVVQEQLELVLVAHAWQAGR